MNTFSWKSLKAPKKSLPQDISLFQTALQILPNSDIKVEFLHIWEPNNTVNTEGYKHAVFKIISKLPQDLWLRVSALAHTDYWLPIAIALAMHHISVSAVSIVLHRNETHGAVQLDPLIKAVAKVLIRINSPIVAKEWVAAHTQHHPQSDNIWDESSSELGDPHTPTVITEKPWIWRNTKHFFGWAEGYFEAIDVIYRHSENDKQWKEIHSSLPQSSVRILGEKPWKIPRYGPAIWLFVTYLTTLWWDSALIMVAIQFVLWTSTIVTVNGAWHGAEEKNEWSRGDYSINIASSWDTMTGRLLNDINNFVTAGEWLCHGNHHTNMKSADFTFGDPKITDIGYYYLRKLEELGLAWDIKASTANAPKVL